MADFFLEEMRRDAHGMGQAWQGLTKSLSKAVGSLGRLFVMLRKKQKQNSMSQANNQSEKTREARVEVTRGTINSTNQFASSLAKGLNVDSLKVSVNGVDRITSQKIDGVYQTKGVLPATQLQQLEKFFAAEKGMSFENSPKSVTVEVGDKTLFELKDGQVLKNDLPAAVKEAARERQLVPRIDQKASWKPQETSVRSAVSSVQKGSTIQEAAVRNEVSKAMKNGAIAWAVSKGNKISSNGYDFSTQDKGQTFTISKDGEELAKYDKNAKGEPLTINSKVTPATAKEMAGSLSGVAQKQTKAIQQEFNQMKAVQSSQSVSIPQPQMEIGK